MSYTIAVAGKGGSGKTTLSALIIDLLLKSNRKPILAVDADPNSNLNEALGVKFDRTVVSTVDGMMGKKEDLPAGLTKERLLESHFQDALVESKGFDLLVMGHTEGPDCYCHANNLLRSFIDGLQQNYPYVVMDNEAGMEHLSRRTTRNADALLIVANPTPVSLRTARQIVEMPQNLKLGIKKSYLVINEENEMHSRIPTEENKAGLTLLGRIPYDEEVEKCSVKIRPLFNLSEDSPARRAVSQILETLLNSQ